MTLLHSYFFIKGRRMSSSFLRVMQREGRRRNDVNHAFQFESLIYLSGSGSGSVSRFRNPKSEFRLLLTPILPSTVNQCHVRNTAIRESWSSNACLVLVYHHLGISELRSLPQLLFGVELLQLKSR